jgi:hypothetical protein
MLYSHRRNTQVTTSKGWLGKDTLILGGDAGGLHGTILREPAKVVGGNPANPAIAKATKPRLHSTSIFLFIIYRARNA